MRGVAVVTGNRGLMSDIVGSLKMAPFHDGEHGGDGERAAASGNFLLKNNAHFSSDIVTSPSFGLALRHGLQNVLRRYMLLYL